jgi:ATP-dependent exoDNAse (exonuclease V) beta subunit
VLAEVDFADPGDLATLVRRHALRHLPDAHEALQEPIEMIDRFLGSSRAKDLATARQLHRELEFLLVWPPGGGQPDGRYLEGFIDCLYQDAAGRWRLIDYKTNRVTAQSLDRVAADYEVQMLVYALAVERILKCPPEELVLCFLRPGEEYHFSWDERARVRVVELVERAMVTG